jgi:hypothetical protein
MVSPRNTGTTNRIAVVGPLTPSGRLHLAVADMNPTSSAP